MNCWSGSLPNPREYHWSGVCFLMHHLDRHSQTHRNSILQQMVGFVYRITRAYIIGTSGAIFLSPSSKCPDVLSRTSIHYSHTIKVDTVNCIVSVKIVAMSTPFW